MGFFCGGRREFGLFEIFSDDETQSLEKPFILRIKISENLSDGFLLRNSSIPIFLSFVVSLESDKVRDVDGIHDTPDPDHIPGFFL